MHADRWARRIDFLWMQRSHWVFRSNNSVPSGRANKRRQVDRVALLSRKGVCDLRERPPVGQLPGLALPDRQERPIEGNVHVRDREESTSLRDRHK
jgi:hypothetical protein